MFGLMEAVAQTSCILYRFRFTKSAGKLIRMAKKTVENELDPLCLIAMILLVNNDLQIEAI